MPINELRVLNAFIGFCIPNDRTWPSPLAFHSYEILGIGREVMATLPNGNDRTVSPDLMCSSPTIHHVLCVEAKRKTLDVNQERAYEALTPQAFVRQTGLISTKYKTSRLTHDVLLATGSDLAESFIRSLDVEGISLPVVALDDEMIALVRGNLNKREIDNVLDAGISVHGAVWPTKYVRFNSESKPAEMVAPVINSVLRLIRTGRTFDADAVANGCLDFWDKYGVGEKRSIRAKVAALVNQASVEELSPYISGNPKANGTSWTVPNGRPRKPQTVNAIERAVNSFTQRVQNNVPYRPQQHRLGAIDSPSSEE